MLDKIKQYGIIERQMEEKTQKIYEIIIIAKKYNKDFGDINGHIYSIRAGYDGHIKLEYLESGSKKAKVENISVLPTKIKNTEKLLKVQKDMLKYVKSIEKDIKYLNKQIDEIRNS
jgi:hypothetical protein